MFKKNKTGQRNHARMSGTTRTVIIILIVVGIIASLLAGLVVYRQARTSIERRVEGLAHSLLASELSMLSVNEGDLTNETYKSLKSRLEQIHDVNSDIRFIYLSTLVNDQVIFMVDSEDPSSEDYSAPGDVYEEPTVEFKSVFTTGVAIVEGPVSDSFGNWFSGIAAINNANGGQGPSPYTVGIDVPASQIYRSVGIVAAIPLFAVSGLIALVVIQDRSRRKQEEFTDYKNWLVTVASHELRSPLVGLRWMLEASQTTGKQFSNDKMLGSVNELINTTEDVLALSTNSDKGSTTQKDDVDLKKITQQIIQRLELVALQKSVTVTVKDPSPDTTSVVFGDQAQLKRVMSNLISNAIKYTKNDTVVTVRYYVQGSMYGVSVSDQGVGIPVEDQQNVFIQNFRAANAKNSNVAGTGLGLNIAKQIIEAHNGTISFVSKEGEGTTFTFELPMKK